MPYCLGCGSMIDEWDSAYYARNMFCIPCYNRKMSEAPMATCNKCGMRIRQDEGRHRHGSTYCHYCHSELERIERLPSCRLCRRKIERHERKLRTAGGDDVHERCAQKGEGSIKARCSFCGAETAHFRLSKHGKILCSRCSEREARRAASGPSEKDAGNAGLFAAVVDRIGAFLG